jgi:outer membrane protein
MDLKVGAGYTSLSPSGWVKYKGDSIDVEKDLRLGDSKNLNAYIQIGLPVLPNIKLEYLPTKYEGEGQINKSFTFGNVTFNASDTVKSKIDVKQYDLSLFYNLPIPVVTPRLGLAVKYLDGYVDIRTINTNQHERKSLNAPIPMVYAGVNVAVPVIPVELDVEGKGIAYKGNSLIDVKGMVMLTITKIPMIGKAYIGGGYRYQKLKLDDVDGLYSDIKFKGLVGEVGFSF